MSITTVSGKQTIGQKMKHKRSKTKVSDHIAHGRINMFVTNARPVVMNIRIEYFGLFRFLIAKATIPNTIVARVQRSTMVEHKNMLRA